MHVEKNIAVTLTGFLLGDDDTIAVRKDLQEQGVMEDLHLVRDKATNSYLKPQAPYVLRASEKQRVLQAIKNVRTPSGHCANFSKLVNLEKGKFQFMRSHDWHVLLEEVLPSTLRGSLPDGPRLDVIRLGQCFKRICEKQIKVSDLRALQTYEAETCSL
ncbi:hypothetical protein KC19_VG210300 [Ceratodon purpureus]|uniref:Uncharacterized protein n=1 Tax=Ceratodon purpureus TaxID=3225 RepID=A0A8T0HS75_CERPU|nr:hypothetical protein KC19_VG210300 [Ceratodon purpureus]